MVERYEYSAYGETTAFNANDVVAGDIGDVFDGLGFEGSSDFMDDISDGIGGFSEYGDGAADAALYEAIHGMPPNGSYTPIY